MILPLLAFPELVFGQQTLYVTDLTWIHYPGRFFAASEWLAGRVPLWDPYQHLGAPLLADTQVSALYPLSILFFSPLPPALELSLFVLVHFCLAATFTFILACFLGMGRAGAAVAGLAFGFGGFLMAQTPNLTIMSGASWLPLVLYGIIRATRQRTWLAALAAGAPLALQIFTAQPQIVLYTLLTISGYGLYRLAADFLLRSSPHRHNIRYALQTGLLLTTAITGGLLLAAPQLLPTLELQQLSPRAQDRGFDFLTQNSLPPRQWLNLLLPSAFGNNVTGFKGDPFQEDFVYAGFFPLVLALFSWRQRHRRDLAFFYLLLGAGAVLAMGSYTPLYQSVIRYLPLFSLFRIPARWLMVVNLALAMLAGFGLESILTQGLSRRALTGLLSGGCLLGLILFVLWRWPQSPGDVQAPLLTELLDKAFSYHDIYQDRLLLRRLTLLTVPAFLLLANMATAASLLALFFTRRLAANVFAALVILAAAIDLTLAGGTTINPVKPLDFWQQRSGGAQYVLDNLHEGRIFPVGASSEEQAISHLGQGFASIYRLPSAAGFGSPLKLRRYDTFLHAAHPVQAIRLTGVRYLLAPAYLGDDVAATYPIVYSDDNSLVYENKDPLPRAFVVHQATWAQRPDQALAYFKSVDLDPRQRVILEAGSAPPPVDPPARPTSPAIISREHSQAVEITVNLNAAGYLVLLDTYYPGWVASVDGAPTPIYRANYIVRAVYVPAGEHTIRFDYRPRSFWVGAALALLALLIITVAWLNRYRKDRGAGSQFA
ncbi:MAG: YfhO family protein [Chloroflexota bacterium]